MPIYEFRCKACDRVFEKLCAVGVDVAALSCDQCQGALVRKFSTFRVGGFPAEPVEGDTTPRSQSSGGCSSCSSQSCSTCSVL